MDRRANNAKRLRDALRRMVEVALDVEGFPLEELWRAEKALDEDVLEELRQR